MTKLLKRKREIGILIRPVDKIVKTKIGERNKGVLF